MLSDELDSNNDIIQMRTRRQHVLWPKGLHEILQCALFKLVLDCCNFPGSFSHLDIIQSKVLERLVDDHSNN